jgi:acyl carrier protein phosphodiesterase
MNFLAHSFLSFGDESLLLGNLLGDFVKGKQYLNFPEPIQQGILLHREIDRFTDEHPLTREAKQFFRPDFGLYAGVFVDPAFDHFLANDKRYFNSHADLRRFTNQVYDTVTHLSPSIPFPEPFIKTMYWMPRQDWLYEYRLHEGIHRSFGGVVRRARYMTDAAPAVTAFEAHYEAIHELYTPFMSQLFEYVKNTLKGMGKNIGNG